MKRSPVCHNSTVELGLIIRYFSYLRPSCLRFLELDGFSADVSACRRAFPGMLTFDQFLRATHWEQAKREYDDGFTYDLDAAGLPPTTMTSSRDGGTSAAAAAGVRPSGASR